MNLLVVCNEERNSTNGANSLPPPLNICGYTFVAEDIVSLRKIVSGQQERVMEAEFNYDVEDATSALLETERIVKIRKLNKKIGDNLKLL